MSYNSDSKAWATVGTPGFSLGRADDLTLSFNSTNVPFVAYSDVGNGNRGVVKKLNDVGTGWDAVGSMEFSFGGAFDISLALSGSGVPYIAFEDGASELRATVMRPKASGSGWEVVGVNGFSESSVYHVSLAFDKTGVPFVAYQDSKIAGRGRVMKLNSASTGWEVVGAAGFASGSIVWVSLKFDSAGVPYVGYHDTGTGRKASVDKIIFAP